MIKQVSVECENQKSKLRTVRKKYMDKVKVIEKSKTTSKDDIDRMKKKIDEITDMKSKEMMELMKKKEKELEIWLDTAKIPSFWEMSLYLCLFWNYDDGRYAYWYSNVFVYRYGRCEM